MKHPSSDSQDGPLAEIGWFSALFVVLTVLLVVIFLLMFTGKPSEKPSMLNFEYNAECLKPFILPEGYDVQTCGREWAKWDTDGNGLQKMCDLFNDSIGFFNQSPKDPGVVIMAQWVDDVVLELEKTPITNPVSQGIPWGDDWQPFSVSLSITLAYYLVSNFKRPSTTEKAILGITYLIRHPLLSLGYARTTMVSAMLLFPWVVCNMFKNSSVVTDPAYLYAVQQFNLTPDNTLRGNESGLHIDYSVISRDAIGTYDELEALRRCYSNTVQVVPELIKSDILTTFSKIDKIFKHPSIPLSGGTLFHRRGDLMLGTYPDGLGGRKCEVVPNLKYMRMFGADYQWCIRAPQEHMAWYESDKLVNYMGLYATFLRERLTTESSAKATFPRDGFFGLKDSVHLPSVRNGMSNPSSHFLAMSESLEQDGAQESFCFSDCETWAVLTHRNSNYDDFSSQPQVSEKVCIDIKNEVVYIDIWFDGWVDTDMKIWYGGTAYDLNDNHVFVKLNLRTGVWAQTEAWDLFAKAFDGKYVKYPLLEGVHDNVVGGVMIKNKETGCPVWFCPACDTVFSDEITVVGFDSQVCSFTFNTDLNQYIFKEFKPRLQAPSQL